MRRFFILGLFAAGCAAAEKVDFGYAFAPPHRITVARPSANEKTLLDLEPGSLTAGWTYDDLRRLPLAILKPPRTQWRVRVRPLVDGQPFASSKWTRGERFLPMLDNVYEQRAASVRLEAIGGEAGALIRVRVRNTDTAPHLVAVECEVLSGWVAHNPSWIEPGRDPDTLLACQGDRADRVLMLSAGAASYPTDRMKTTLAWPLAPGETRTGWIVRPYEAYQENLPALRVRDWAREFAAATKEWSDLLARAVRLDLGDAGVRDAFYAGLGDLFIMREPLAGGYMGGVPGTEGYRSTAPFEPSLAAIALDQTGFHAEAADGMRVHLDMQEPDGNWADPKGWAHHMWGASGMKAWAAMEHYRLTGDRAYLEAVYPRMRASSRWQELQRRKSRVPEGGARAPEYGLMPRGMGDGGLMNGKDYFGVFYPHNILAVFADKLSLEAAGILGRKEDLAGLRRIYETSLADLRASMEAGAIEENGIRWIPGSPRDPSGSRWGGLYALFPAELLPPDHPLITGTIRKMELSLSPGGQPLNTGWMTDGAWVAITLDNLAEAHLIRGDADRAAQYLYSTLNHGTPLYSWCEERGQEAGTKKTSGDRQHLWTPLAVVRYVRDAMVLEQGATLHLAAGTARSWLEQGKTAGIGDAPTHFGNVSYRIVSDVDRGLLRAEVDAPTRRAPSAILLHLRHPRRATLKSVTVNGKPWTDFDPARETVRLPASPAKIHVEASY
jgi:hypothetical protein